MAGELRRCLANGFTGLKLHTSNSFVYTDPVYAEALGVANERRLPVLLHTWGSAADFVAVRELAAKYPTWRTAWGRADWSSGLSRALARTESCTARTVTSSA